MKRQKILPELSALNFEARERHISYGQLMAKTTEKERKQIIEKWRKYYATKREADAEVKRAERAEQYQRFRDLYGQGLSDSEIAAMCGCKAGKVRYWREKRGLSVNDGRKKGTK